MTGNEEMSMFLKHRGFLDLPITNGYVYTYVSVCNLSLNNSIFRLTEGIFTNWITNIFRFHFVEVPS